MLNFYMFPYIIANKDKSFSYSQNKNMSTPKVCCKTDSPEFQIN